MEIPSDILSKLICANCGGYLSRGPVFSIRDDKSLCGRCIPPKQGAYRMKPYEEVAKLLVFPCRYKKQGCTETIKFQHNQQHEDTCGFRQFVCPIVDSGKCEWFGTRYTFFEHSRRAHPKNVIKNPLKLTHNITRSSLRNYLLSAFNVLFLIQTKVCMNSKKIYHSVRLIGDPRCVGQYKFDIAIENKKGVKIIKPGTVAPAGCLAMQEDISVPIGINNMLAELGDFKETVFTVTVRMPEYTTIPRRCPLCKLPLYFIENAFQCRKCKYTSSKF